MKSLITIALVAVAICAATIAEAGNRVQFVSSGHCNQQVVRVQRFSSPQRVQRVVVQERVRFVDSGRRNNLQIGLLNFSR